MNRLILGSVLLPLSAPAEVDFVKEVQPILERQCVRCHREESTYVTSGDTNYVLTTAKQAIRGRFIIPGKSAESKVYSTTVVPNDDDKLMPPLREIELGAFQRLSKEQAATLKSWIDEGAKWPDGVTLVSRDRPWRRDNAALVAEIHELLTDPPHSELEREMKPYSEKIPRSDVAFDLVPIPAGKFKIGSPETEPGRQPNESPQKEIVIEPFWMGKCEVTRNEFDLFVFRQLRKRPAEGRGLNPDEVRQFAATDAVAEPSEPAWDAAFGMGADGFPAILMTQFSASKYCQWLSAATGHYYRLPTEAEWEYAARAGTTTAYYWGDDPAKLDEYEWSRRTAPDRYGKVGKKKPNPWGLHDMLGNVSEWTLDRYLLDAYAPSPAVVPLPDDQPPPHVIRGGSFDDAEPALFRAARRRAPDPEWKLMNLTPRLRPWWYANAHQVVGFRVVRPLKIPTAAEMEKAWSGDAPATPRER